MKRIVSCLIGIVIGLVFTTKIYAVRWTLSDIQKLYDADKFSSVGASQDYSQLVKISWLQNVKEFARSNRGPHIIDYLIKIGEDPRYEVIAMEVLTVCDESRTCEEVLYNFGQLIRFYEKMCYGSDYWRELFSDFSNYVGDMKK